VIEQRLHYDSAMKTIRLANDASDQGMIAYIATISMSFIGTKMLQQR